MTMRCAPTSRTSRSCRTACVKRAAGRAESLSLAEGGNKASLADEISALEGADAIDDELEQMKRALGKSGDPKQEG